MRLPLRKPWRAFEELDRFSDAECRAWMLHIRKAKIGRNAIELVVVLIGLGAALIPIEVVVEKVIEFDERLWHEGLIHRDSFSYPALVTYGVLTITATFVAAFLVRDLRSRAILRKQLGDTRCPHCRYSLLGLALRLGAVVCPECGYRFELTRHGLTPDDLMARTERRMPRDAENRA